MITKHMNLVCALAASLLAGCMGAADGGDTEAHTTGLVQVGFRAEPLQSVSSNAWRGAPRDCHGRLPSDVHFELVREGLVVAIDSLGNPLCVDSIENVQRELEDGGRLSEASNLEDSYLLAVGLAMPSTDIGAGDPTPQPSCDDMDTTPGDPADTGELDNEIDKGDPTPQPSTEPRDPSET